MKLIYNICRQCVKNHTDASPDDLAMFNVYWLAQGRVYRCPMYSYLKANDTKEVKRCLYLAEHAVMQGVER